MSIVEFLYFFTVRLAFEVFDKHRGNKSVRPDEVQDKEKHRKSLAEIGNDFNSSRAQNLLRDSYPKTTALAPSKENVLPERVIQRSESVQIFWNEISRRKDKKTLRNLES